MKNKTRHNGRKLKNDQWWNPNRKSKNNRRANKHQWIRRHQELKNIERSKFGPDLLINKNLNLETLQPTFYLTPSETLEFKNTFLGINVGNYSQQLYKINFFEISDLKEKQLLKEYSWIEKNHKKVKNFEELKNKFSAYKNNRNLIKICQEGIENTWELQNNKIRQAFEELKKQLYTSAPSGIADKYTEREVALAAAKDFQKNVKDREKAYMELINKILLQENELSNSFRTEIRNHLWFPIKQKNFRNKKILRLDEIEMIDYVTDAFLTNPEDTVKDLKPWTRGKREIWKNVNDFNNSDISIALDPTTAKLKVINNLELPAEATSRTAKPMGLNNVPVSNAAKPMGLNNVPVSNAVKPTGLNNLESSAVETLKGSNKKNDNLIDSKSIEFENILLGIVPVLIIGKYIYNNYFCKKLKKGHHLQTQKKLNQIRNKDKDDNKQKLLEQTIIQIEENDRT